MMTRLNIKTETAFLPSRGYNGQKWTKHHYVYSELVTLYVKTSTGQPVRGMAHIFKCTETGETRRWGCDRLPNEKPEKDDDVN